MKDLSGHDATLKNRLDTIFRFLAVEALFILGLGLGWSLGLFANNHALSHASLFLLGLGFLTGFAALGIYLWKRALEVPHYNSHNAIDIKDSLRALRIHGSQVPLIDRPNMRSEMLCISKNEQFLLPEMHRFILEHWRGPDAEITLMNAQLDFSAEQILYFDSQQLEFFEKGKRILRVNPINIQIDEDLVFVLHIFPKDN